MSNLFNKLLVILCMVDLLVILSTLILAGKTLFPKNYILNMLTPWCDCLCHIAISASVFMTITITVERYCAVNSPYTYQIRLIEKGFWSILLCHVLPVLCAAIILNIPKMLQVWKILPMLPREYEQMSIKSGIIYQVVHPVLTTCLAPIVILTVLNYKIVRASRQRLSTYNKMSSEIRMAKMMMIIVIVFILLNLPRMSLSIYEIFTIPNILECYERHCPYHISKKRWLMDSMVRYMVMLNSSINFIIYCFVGSSFRSTLRELFMKKLGTSKAYSPGLPSRARLSSTSPTSVHSTMLQTISGPL